MELNTNINWGVLKSKNLSAKVILLEKQSPKYFLFQIQI